MSFNIYRYGTLALGSQLAFPELSLAPELTPSVVFKIRRAPRRVATASEPLHEWRSPEGALYASFRRNGDRYLIHFKRRALFEVSGALSTVHCTPICDASPLTLRHLFLDQVMPLILAMTGRHVLHASAVECQGDAVAFVGKSGMGKSTIAAAIGRGRGRILADDCLLLDEHGGQFLAASPYSSLRLWTDSVSALELTGASRAHRTWKRQFLMDSGLSFQSSPSPLRAVFFLTRPRRGRSEVVTAMSPAEAVVALVGSAFKLDIRDRSYLQAEFRLFSRLVTAVPCYRLVVRKSLAGLPRVMEAVVRALDVTAVSTPDVLTA